MSITLVTGAAGFIGSRVAAGLLERGETVLGVDSLNDYYDARLKKHRLEKLANYPGFTFKRVNIEDSEQLVAAMEGCKIDAILNLAARAGVRSSIENPHVYVSTNTVGTLNLLEAMRGRGIKKMVLASTSSLYAGQSVPYSEDLPVNTPISPYAASKKAAEAMAYCYHYLHGIDISIVRYFTVYGPAGRPDMSIFRFIKWVSEGQPIQVYGDGEQSRDFTYIDDIAEGTIEATKEVGYEVFNLGGGREPTTLNQVIKRIETLVGRKAEVVYQDSVKADVESTRADIEKASNYLGWEPKIGIDEGLERTVDWHRKMDHLVRGISLG